MKHLQSTVRVESEANPNDQIPESSSCTSSNATARAVPEELKSAGFVRIRQVLAVIPISRSAWWHGIKVGHYPKGIKLSAGVTAWAVQDIQELALKLRDGAGPLSGAARNEFLREELLRSSQPS